MLFPGTQMHLITFLLTCAEMVILLYLLIYRLARPDDKTARLNLMLIFLLLLYNVTGGLLPDEHLPGSVFLQTSLAYATGFITPCYFPYYVYHAFKLEKMRFHAYRGVFLCLIIPYLLFVIVYGITGKLELAKNLLILPVLYAAWVIYSLHGAIRYKYKNDLTSKLSREEITVLFLSLSPWLVLPVIDYFNLGQAVEASVTNLGFLALFAFQMKRQIQGIRNEHEQVLASEQKLKTWNTTLQAEVNRQTGELKKINEQQMRTFIHLAHETKTPFTLISAYLEEYIASKGNSPELEAVQRYLNRLFTDISNMFDVEKLKRGFAVYNHNQVADFSVILSDTIQFFRIYAAKKGITIRVQSDDPAFIRADPLSVHRIINNLLENAVKFSGDGSVVHVLLQSGDGTIRFTVQDSGAGIEASEHSKIFEPYYQISASGKTASGMGLGLPIVKMVVQSLGGDISLYSQTRNNTGTTFTVALPQYYLMEDDTVSRLSVPATTLPGEEEPLLPAPAFNPSIPTILLAEDNNSLLTYLTHKLAARYNILPARSGKEALIILKGLRRQPDLIISDVMMDGMDGFTFAGILADSPLYQHIPFIFLSAKSALHERMRGLQLGAVDFISKPCHLAELLFKIDALLKKVELQRKDALTRAIQSLQQSAEADSTGVTRALEQQCQRYKLTVREKEIARLIQDGYSYKEIGATLFIAEKTVAKHVEHIFEKVGVSNKIELIRKLMQ
jgi:signal transduction histidine kinase/DNA-binding NarL/FixJ family response regulator